MSQKPTAEEKTERVDLVAYLLCMGHSSSSIHKIVGEKYNCTTRTVDNYITEAKQQLVEQSDQPRGLHIGMALEVYRAVLRDENASHSDRISAQRRIDVLLGLEAPRRLAHEGPDGGPVKVETNMHASIIMNDPELREQATSLGIAAARRLSAN